MVVHYPRTVWKNSYAEHEVTGKTYNKKKKKSKPLQINHCSKGTVTRLAALVGLVELSVHTDGVQGLKHYDKLNL